MRLARLPAPVSMLDPRVGNVPFLRTCGYNAFDIVLQNIREHLAHAIIGGFCSHMREGFSHSGNAGQRVSELVLES